MGDDTSARTMNDRIVPKRSFMSWKEKPYRTKDYLDFLAHYDAELRPTNGSITVVRRKNGAELPLEQKGKSLMVKLLMDEFGTIDAANKAIGGYRTSH